MGRMMLYPYNGQVDVGSSDATFITPITLNNYCNSFKSTCESSTVWNDVLVLVTQVF